MWRSHTSERKGKVVHCGWTENRKGVGTNGGESGVSNLEAESIRSRAEMNHTHTHVCTHTHSITHTYAHTHTLSHTRMHTHTHTLSHTRMHTHSIPRMHTQNLDQKSMQQNWLGKCSGDNQLFGCCWVCCCFLLLLFVFFGGGGGGDKKWEQKMQMLCVANLLILV